MATVEERTVPRTAGEALADSRSVVDPALRSAVDSLPPAMRNVAGYHFGWWDEHGNELDAGAGKVIRPTAALLAAEAVGGSPAAAVPAAVAVELVHNFSLLHDDVMDGDATRRHRPTAWSVFGAGAAILAGDALLNLAMDVLAACGAPAAREGARMLNGAVRALIDGQSLDLAFESRAEVELEECLSMTEGKTGALLGCACALGAAFGGGTDHQVACLRRFGARLGLAFQHVDDLLGIWGDPAVTGKPIHADLRVRKKTLPVVAALGSATPAGRELAALYRRDAPLTGLDPLRAAELVDRAGGRAWSRAQADELRDDALRHLRSAGAAPRSSAELEGLARLVTRRDH